jgi:hypothetical protein
MQAEAIAEAASMEVEATVETAAVEATNAETALCATATGIFRFILVSGSYQFGITSKDGFSFCIPPRS